MFLIAGRVSPFIGRDPASVALRNVAPSLTSMSGTYPQSIPRPERWEFGDPAPWAHLDARVLEGLNIARVKAALHSRGLTQIPELPFAAHERTIKVADGIPPEGPLRDSAVLIALFEEEGEARVILTRRSSRLRTHKGEVSFPGGRRDEGEDFIETALREAHEEIGLPPSAVDVIGALAPIVTLVSGALIQPIVGVLPQRPAYVRSPYEVERVFDVSLSELLAEDVFHEERWFRPELSVPGRDHFPLWFFEVSGEMIWGATGRLLVDLLALALGVEHVSGYEA